MALQPTIGGAERPDPTVHHAGRYGPSPKRLLWRRAEQRLDVLVARKSPVLSMSLVKRRVRSFGMKKRGRCRLNEAELKETDLA